MSAPSIDKRADKRADREKAGRAWPLLVLPAVLFLVFAIAWFSRYAQGLRPRALGEVSSAVAQGLPPEVEGFTGELELADGGRLRARLTPLQLAPAWEAFDAEALGARLGLERGEPWRLELVHEADDKALAAPPVRLLPARVEDASGRALHSVEAAAPTSLDGSATPDVVDPVRALFAQPPGELPGGAEIHLLLWGRRPGDGAQLSLGHGAATRTLALERSSIPSLDIRRSLAVAPDGESNGEPK